MFFGDDHGGEAVVGRRDTYWASGRSAVTNSFILSVLWALGTFGADRNVQHWTEPWRSAGVGNSTVVHTGYHEIPPLLKIMGPEPSLFL